MNKAILAEYLVSRQPRIIRNRLDRSAVFGERLGLQTRTLVTVGNVGQFDEELLLICAREACSNGAEHSLFDACGTEAVIGRDAQGLTLRSSRTHAAPAMSRVDELLVFSPDARERHAAVTRLIELIGPTSDNLSNLAGVADERELSIAEGTGLLHELWGGITALQARAAEALASRGSVEDLVPSSLGYYERFCGPEPVGPDAEEYLESLLSDHRRQLLGRDLRQGLAIALVGNLRADLSPARWLNGVSDDQLWEVLVACEPRRDPFSLLGALDIACSRRHDRRYLAFAEEAIGLLTAAELSRPDGTDAYVLMSLFLRLASARLVLAEGGAVRPPIWRRLCSWTQAGLLCRLCWSVKLDLETVCASVASAETLAVSYGRMLDLHRVPMYSAGEVSAQRLRAEVLGRLVLLCRHHETAGDGIPNTEAVIRACERLSEEGSPLVWEVPGPLEGHIRPTRVIPTEIADALANGLKQSPNTGVWARLAYVSQICRLSESLTTQMPDALRNVHGTTRSDERRQIFEVFYAACRVAAAHRDSTLADAVAVGIQQQGPTADVEDVAGMLGLLLLAGAAFADEKQRSAWLKDRFANLAFRLPVAAASRFRECLEELRHVAPMLNAFWAQAEFLSAAA